VAFASAAARAMRAPGRVRVSRVLVGEDAIVYYFGGGILG